MRIRRATPDDAGGIASVLEAVAAERAYSAIDRAWPADAQRRYLQALSEREAFHVAVAMPEAGHGDGRRVGPEIVVGYQSVDRYSTILPSMAHVAQVGTFILPAWRRRGLGGQLFEATKRFALSVGYRKLVIYVRGSNAAAQAFYRGLGFVPCGRLTRQVVIDGREDDEVLMEYFLAGPAVSGGASSRRL